MAYMRPCIDCPHRELDGVACPIKTEKLAIIRRANLTLVNFKCPKRLSELQPGQRVELSMGYDGRSKAYIGTVMRSHKTRLLVWLDELSPMGRNPVALRPNGLVPIAGELVEICYECGQPAGTRARVWHCWGNRKCLNRLNPERVEDESMEV